MLSKQTSETIFLQPIDQHYDDKSSEDTSEHGDDKFLEDSQGVVDCLNISTDSETDNSFDNDIIKLSDKLVNDWELRVELFKTFQLCLNKTSILQWPRLQTSFDRSLSCPTVLKMNSFKPINPFTLAGDGVNNLNNHFEATCIDFPK
jgi:hypothetical protein